VVPGVGEPAQHEQADQVADLQRVRARVRPVVETKPAGLDPGAQRLAVSAVLHEAAGLEVGDTGGIRVNSKLETATEGLFAAGDVAEYESVVHGGRLRVEHWDVAFNQGRAVAHNMLGKEADYDVVPYFFSDLSDWASMEYVGPAYEWDREVVRGSPDEGKFTVFYVQQGRVAGALTVGRSDDLGHARRWIADHTDLGDHLDQLGDLSSDLGEL